MASTSTPNVVTELLDAFKKLHEDLAPLHILPSLGGENTPELNADLRKIGRHFDARSKEWRSSQERRGMVAALSRQMPATKHVHKEYCFGLGSIWDLSRGTTAKERAAYRGMLLQLAQMIDRVRMINRVHEELARRDGTTSRRVDMFAQDTNFKQQDLDFLRYLHITPSQRPDEFQAQVDANSSLYCPHLAVDVDLWPVYNRAQRPAIIITNLATLSDFELRVCAEPDVAFKYWEIHKEPISRLYSHESIDAWASHPGHPENGRDPMWWALADMRLWIRRDIFYQPPNEQQS